MKVQLKCHPPITLIDDVVHIKVLNLPKQQQVTLSVKTEENKKVFGSYAHYTASNEGIVDLIRDSTARTGMYSGVEPMGLFWSMISAPGQRSGERLVKTNASIPLSFEIEVYFDHISWDNVWDNRIEPVAKETILRSYMGPNVKRIEIEDGQIRGTLFLPHSLDSGETRPGVIDMFGGRGGLLESRAGLLASHGFITLALAYFNYKDIPVKLTLDYEYFEEAVKWLYNHPSVSPNGIGMIGVSLGAQIACYMGLNCPLIKAVIAINYPPVFSPGVKFSHKGSLIPSVPLENISLSQLFNDMYQFDAKLDHDKYFQYNTSHNPKILFIVGLDDPTAPESEYLSWKNSLSPERKSNVELAVYPGAGHLIEPPYAPLCVATYNKRMNLVVFYGGKTKEHALAQEKSWRKIQNFLWSNLQSIPKSQL